MSLSDKFLEDFCSLSNRFSDNISVYYVLDDNKSLGISYFELNKTSDELSRYFSNLLGENRQYIGVSLSDYFLLPCIILGIWKSKNCFCGIGTQYTRQNTIDFLNFLGVKFLITDTDKDEYGYKLISPFFMAHRQFFVWQRQTESEIRLLECICYGIMTSGSTGDPKIIQVPWSCILPNAIELSVEFQVTELDCIFSASPYSFDPFFIELLMAFINGCALMIVSKGITLCPSNLLKALFDTADNSKAEKKTKEFKSSKDYLFKNCPLENENCFHLTVQNVSKKNVTILQMTPSVFKRWTDTEISNFILSSKTQLRVLILGGERFPKQILKLKHSDNQTKIFNIYGITEISCWAFLKEVSATGHLTDSEISIGRPLKSIVYEISKNGEFKIGSCQRICLLNTEHLFELENTVYRETGDIVKLSNEEIYYVGRTNQIVKKYGIKINLNKIEEAFRSENKLINDCFCIYDEENLKLGLFYIPVNKKLTEKKYDVVTAEEFHKNDYKIPISMIKSIEKPDYIIEITKAPLNLHGKCDKKQLLLHLKEICKNEQQKPDIKIIFKKLWFEVLGIPQNIPLISFTDSGGNSVLALDLINKLEDAGVSVPQNFITYLLGGETYDACFECLTLVQEKCEIPKKRSKANTEISEVKLYEVWKFDLEKCVDAPGCLFLYEGEERLVIGSHSSKLSCINPASGCEIWSTFLGDRIESGFTPTKDGSRGIIGCYDHCAYCIATSDGSVIWKFQTGDVIKSTPCLSTDEKIVFVASYDKILYYLSTAEGQLYKALKLSNGGIRCPGTVSEAYNSFFIGTLDGTCLAISQDTYKPLWKTTLESPVFAAPCLIPKKAEVLFVEVLGYVHCLNVLNGRKIWTFKAGGNIYSSPTVKALNGTIHIIFGCHDANLYCLHYEKAPELKWKNQLDSSIFATPSLVLDFLSVCAVTTKGFVYLCDFFFGSVKSQLKLAGELFSPAVPCKNRLFLGCRDNNVYSLEISIPKDADSSSQVYSNFPENLFQNPTAVDSFKPINNKNTV